ncbi:zinc finger protein 804B isoform X2 [Paroedura picta]
MRKQSECVAGCRPVCKTPQGDEEKQPELQEELLFVHEDKTKTTAKGQILASSTTEQQQELAISKAQPCMERCHLLRNHVSPAFPCGTNACNRTGVSFSFSKKVHLKLESSASVFSENLEEAYDCTGSPRHPVKPSPQDYHTCIHMSDEKKTTIQKRLKRLQSHTDSLPSRHPAETSKMVKEKDHNANTEYLENHLHPPDLGCCRSPYVKDQERELLRKSSEMVVPDHYQTSNICMQQNTYKHSHVLLAEHVSEFSTQCSSEQGHSCEVNYNRCVFKETGSNDCLKMVNENPGTPRGDALVHKIKSKALPFLHVLSKDGSTALRWPTELILFTKTEPSVSYGCNPLYFDFRLSLSHRETGHHDVNLDNCNEHSVMMDIDRNEASGQTKNKQLSDEHDNQTLKPKKKTRALSLQKSQPNLDSDIENEMNQSAPKYISDDLNERIPKVPDHLDCSQKHYTRATGPQTEMHVRSLAQHLQNCEQTLQDENICIYPLMSRIKKQKCVQCDFIYSQRQSKLDLVTCSSDVNNGGKDAILGYKFGSAGKSLETEGKGDFAGFWKFSSLQKSSSDRQSNYSDTSASSATSFASCYSSHRSSDHRRSHLPFCCKRKQKPVERLKYKHKKHNCISSSDEAEEDCLFNNKSQRPSHCTQRRTVKYQRHSRYRHLLHRDVSKQSRNRHPACKHSRCRSYSSSKGSSTRDSGSSERSLSCTRSRGSSSGSLARESISDWNEHNRNMINCYDSEPGKADSAIYDCHNLRCPSKRAGIGPVKQLGKEAVGQPKSITAKLLLEKVKSKKIQEQTQHGESFSNVGGIDFCRSPPGTKCVSSVGNEGTLPPLENVLHVSVWNSDPSTVESHANKDQVEASTINKAVLSASTNYNNCLLKNIMQRGPGCQASNMEKDTAINEPSDLLTGEMQALPQSCDPVVPNDFPGAFPSTRYSVVPNPTETKEEHNASLNSMRAEGDFISHSDSAMHKENKTESKTEAYSKCISSPLTQQPITFSPDEIDKYRFLQLQAQQHVQKQLVAKHLKVLSATGPAAFATPPSVQSVPVSPHASVATLHQTFLQSFALSAAVHPHSSHLSLTRIHPFQQSPFAPISLSPFTPAFIPAHSALMTSHPLHLVSATPVHPSHLAVPSLPHPTLIPTLFAPQLSGTVSSAIHLNPFIHPLFQGQEFRHHS